MMDGNRPLRGALGAQKSRVGKKHKCFRLRCRNCPGELRRGRAESRSHATHCTHTLYTTPEAPWPSLQSSTNRSLMGSFGPRFDDSGLAG